MDVTSPSPTGVSRYGAAHKAPPLRLVAVGFHGLRRLLHEAAPAYAGVAEVQVLDRIYDDAVQAVSALRHAEGVDAVVAAGSNGDYLRHHLDLPVVLIKPDGFDLMQRLATAAAQANRIALIMYGHIPPELVLFSERFGLGLEMRSYTTEVEAETCVDALVASGVEAVVAPGLVVDLAQARGIRGILLYSQGAVRDAMSAAIDIARVARQEAARREKLNTLLGQLRDGVIAVDPDERVEIINPAMEAFLGTAPQRLLGRRLSEAYPELTLSNTLRTGQAEVEQVQQVKGRTSVVTRLPIIEQGRQTGAVLVCQDPVAIQRIDRSLRTRNRPPARHAKYALDDLAGDSPAIHAVRERASRCAASDATVLIIGESGTGKELLAQGIHNASGRHAQPFVAINCAAFPESLLESELFGYVEGAFTGSSRGGKIGLFEAAHTGTLFLDEIGEMPLSLQTRLLRVLQEREVLRIGATVPTPVDLRIIAATHRDLAASVAKGEFRQDLYYRLNILVVHLPALRQRVDDLPLLIRHLGLKINQRLNESRPISDDLVDTLVAAGRRYAWPGNIRELENLIERILVFRDASGPAAEFTVAELYKIAPELFSGDYGADQHLADVGYRNSMSMYGGAGDESSGYGLAEAVATRERQQLLNVLRDCGGNREQAASLLGVSRSTLWRRMKQHGLL